MLTAGLSFFGGVIKPPKMVHVGVSDYRIRQVKRLDVLGETDSNNAEILLKKAQAPSVLRDTLVHELLHAVVYASGYFKVADLDRTSEENLVVTLSPWILAILRDNPDLVEYLTQGREV